MPAVNDAAELQRWRDQEPINAHSHIIGMLLGQIRVKDLAAGLDSPRCQRAEKRRAAARLERIAPQDEAVVFLHGFNSPVADALKRVAQLWTLGRFPATLHPYCFGWPGARDVAYFSAKAWCEDNAEMNADFTAFIMQESKRGLKLSSAANLLIAVSMLADPGRTSGPPPPPSQPTLSLTANGPR